VAAGTQPITLAIEKLCGIKEEGTALIAAVGVFSQ
jgi:hypothetical protein